MGVAIAVLVVDVAIVAIVVVVITRNKFTCHCSHVTCHLSHGIASTFILMGIGSRGVWHSFW